MYFFCSDPQHIERYFKPYPRDRKQKDYRHAYKKYVKGVLKHLYQSINTNIFNNNQIFASDLVRKVTKFLLNVRQVKIIPIILNILSQS